MESQHQDWTVKQEKCQGDASKLEVGKTRLESQVQQLESTLEESEAEERRLRQELEAQRLQQKEEQQSHEDKERNLNQTMQELQASVKEKDASLESLNDAIEELRTEASQLTQAHKAQVEDMEATIANLEQENVAQSRQAEDYQNNQDGTNDTIAQLQQRIMRLVEEKLILQTAVETLEHEFMESDLLELNAVSRQLQQKRSPAMVIKEYWHDHQLELQQQQEPPTIVVDENTKQADIIRQTLEHRQSQKLSRRISKKVRGHPTKPKSTQQIDVKATKQLFLQEQQKRELLKKARAQKRTNLSNARPTTAEIGRSNWVRSRDHGVASHDITSSNSGSTEFPEYLGSKQHGFVQSAVTSSSTKEKTTTWTRIRDSIALSSTNKSEGKAQPSDVDDFSLWVQGLSQEQQIAGAKESQQPEEFKSLSVPASMLDSLPVSSNTGRYAVQSIDDVLKEGANGGAEGLTKKLGKREETHADKSYRVAAPAQSKPTLVSKEENQAAAMGQGKAIDQSNLLGFYVSKQKEAANATTIGYLSSMIYGDPEEEESKIQKKLLKRQLAQKKKQEQREREQLKQAVQGTIRTKPKTLFSSFV